MKILLLMTCFALAASLHAQQTSGGPQEVTPEIAAKINAEIAKEIPVLKKKYKQERDEISDEEIAFRIDTFKIEKFFERTVDYDYSTSGMNHNGYMAAEKYDTLLNKYYKLLLGKLAIEDNNILIEAQRAWLVYRDKELKLFAKLRERQYSGGGTIQSNIYASEYLDFIEARVFTLFHNYINILYHY